MKKNLNVIELFAGVGGFRLGLEGWEGKSPSSGYKKSLEPYYKVVWSNQWEPLTKAQHASNIYENRWGKQGHSNEDIASIDVSKLPDFDLLVGGFPCQDYSVATTLKNSKGLIGRKGILWWSIHRVLDEVKQKPHYLLLENVDRLLISPSKQRGRDFAIILQSLNQLGYAVEWRVINAADFGMPQRRRRVFFFAYHSSSAIYKQIKKDKPENWIMENGLIAETFPIVLDPKNHKLNEFKLHGDIVQISEKFNIEGGKGIFLNSGVMINGNISTMKTKPAYEGKLSTLKSIIYKGNIPDEFYLDKNQKKLWEELKGAKKIEREAANGFKYKFSEGAMIFPDSLDKSSRTIITGEGGPSPSRFKHVIETKKGLRRLVPIELERLNMFPDNHTDFDGVTNAKRAFLMGNALVIGIVEKLGATLKKRVFKK
jgi:DNA (cytosine-5)-methyltransferase 1